MSTREYLNGLDYYQLVFAKEYAEELIKAKENETKVRIWVLFDDDVNIAAYLEADYTKALDRLCAEVVKCKTQTPDNLRFGLMRRHVRDSEVKEWLELGGTDECP